MSTTPERTGAHRAPTSRPSRPTAAEGMPFTRAHETMRQVAQDADAVAAWQRVMHEFRALSEKLAQARHDVMDADERARGAFSEDYVRKLRAECATWRTRYRDLEAQTRGAVAD